MQVWSKSTHSFRRQGADKPFANNLSVALKMRSWSPKSNKFFSMSQQYSCTNLVKIHPFIQEIGCRHSFSNNLISHVTLKMGSRSPKSDQFFYMSQQYKCLSLVKIYLFLQEIGCRQAFSQPFSNKLSPCVTLKMGSKSPKSNQHFSSHPMINFSKFGQNPSIH